MNSFENSSDNNVKEDGELTPEQILEQQEKYRQAGLVMSLGLGLAFKFNERFALWPDESKESSVEIGKIIHQKLVSPYIESVIEVDNESDPEKPDGGLLAVLARFVEKKFAESDQ